MAGKPDEKPTVAQVAIQRQWLRDHGVSANIAAQLVNPANTHRQNGNAIAKWLHDRPKAGNK